MPTPARPVVLVTLDWTRPGDSRRSLGSASIVASLRDAGVDCTWIEASVNLPGFDLAAFTSEVLRAVDAAGPDVLVGIGCYVWNEAETRHLLRALAEHGGSDVVLGGPQVSFVEAGDLAWRYPTARWFVRGAGEAAMVDLALGQAQHGVHGLFDATESDHGRRFDGELDALPSPWLTGVIEVGEKVRWETQRGCVYRCSFCQHREPDKRHRRRDIHQDRVTAELERFAASDVQRISVLDPIFHQDHARAVRILRAARALGITARISLQCRFELVKPEFLDALQGLDVTLEFGLQTVQEAEWKAIQRRNLLHRIEPAMAELGRRGIDYEVSLIFGLPEQTLASFLGSVQWCLDRGAPRVLAFPLMLLRGTPMQAERHRWALRESDAPIPEVTSSLTFTEEEMHEMRRVAAWLEVNPGARELPEGWREQAVVPGGGRTRRGAA